MRSDVTIVFDSKRRLDLTVQVEPSPDSGAQARQWLDDTWHALGCEPLRPSGKVLLLDKILGVADAYGHEALLGDETLAARYAEQVALALDKPRVTIDLPGLMVGY